jgi:AcrR family transcriptional regulator
MSSATDEAIIRATRQAALDFGLQRLTMSDIAQRAGVSRQTIYRRHQDAHGVLSDLVAREFAQTLSSVATAVTGANGRAIVVARIVEAVRALRANSLLRKVLDVEPELLLPYVVERLGATQRHAVDLITADVELAQQDGSVRDGDARAMALSLLLVAQSFIFFRGTLIEVPEAALLGELERIVDGTLRAAGGCQ